MLKVTQSSCFGYKRCVSFAKYNHRHCATGGLQLHNSCLLSYKIDTPQGFRALQGSTTVEAFHPDGGVHTLIPFCSLGDGTSVALSSACVCQLLLRFFAGS